MPEYPLKNLQNGSDIRGIALEGVENEKVNLTPETAERLARAFGGWLSRKTGKGRKSLRVSVGCDSRLSSPALKKGVIDGLLKQGIRAADFGLSSTPAMFMSTVMKGYEYDGAVMVTASHLPFNRNGLKFFTAAGGFEKDEIAELIGLAEKEGEPRGAADGEAEQIDFMSAYAVHLADVIRRGVNDPDDYLKPLRGLKVAVDAGNGAGGFYAEKVLNPLGADSSGSRFLEPDGRFPNHIPNPENEAAMRSICGTVLESGADLGIIFDTDVDRAGAVDKQGKEINRNRLVALASAIVLEEHPGSVIVTDSVTSDELTEFIEKNLGGIHRRYKRGYRNVIDEAVRLNAAGRPSWLAMETSGHAALKENYFLDDGAYLVSKILIKAARLRREGKTVDTLLDGLGEPAEAKEFRLRVKADDVNGCGAGVLRELSEYAAEMPEFRTAPDNCEGIRVSFREKDLRGWFLLRMSLHEPIMPLNIESAGQGGVREIGRKVLRFLRRFDALDCSPLEDYCEK